ncbi:hypothetical protein HAX54_031062 [Datura stramonium]|uniref:F-box domain-containing protein n=1 Tax=Datura stramonium TaxID=4076 RepID=A0ABS8VAL6_DATST|nr:hypothetical protein [Datura stramonium]
MTERRALGETRSPENYQNPSALPDQKSTMDSGETAVDRISQLPDCLLLQILSLMPTDETLVTSALSKRWRYLWNSLDTFSFSIFDYHEGYVSYVDYVLAHSVSPKIKKFQLDSHEPGAYQSHIDRWFSFAVEKKVENVELRSNSDEEVCALPECLYTCSSLITLVLGFCYFDANVFIAWKSLKSIKLKWMVLSDDHIVNLLRGCPALETMELSNFKGFSRLEIRSSKLKRLNLIEYNDEEIDHSLEIVAPYLQHLEISKSLYGLKCRLVDVSSLVNAKLTFNITCIKEIKYLLDDEVDDEEDSCRDYHQGFMILVQDYLQKLSCASKITIGTWFTEVLCMLQFKGVPIPELKCKYLTLELHTKKFSAYGAAGLLRASPDIETFNIDIAAMHPVANFCCFGSQDLAKGDNIELQSWISGFAFPNLKNVKIAISSRSRICLMDHLKWSYVKTLFKLSEFLLKNASVLEKFVIISKRRQY